MAGAVRKGARDYGAFVNGRGLEAPLESFIERRGRVTILQTPDCEHRRRTKHGGR
jgi:hypothetical protein